MLPNLQIGLGKADGPTGRRALVWQTPSDSGRLGVGSGTQDKLEAALWLSKGST